MGTGGSSLPSSPLWLYPHDYLAHIYFIYWIFLRRLTTTQQIYLTKSLCDIFFVFLSRKNYRILIEKSSYTQAFLSFYWDQALDLLVSVSYTHYCAYTSDLSTLLSARGLTTLRYGIPYLEASFTLRCFQRLSQPHSATLLCHWRDNRCTVGAFIPVLSY